MSRATELALNHGRLYHTLGTAYWGFSSAQLEAFYHAARAEALREAADYADEHAAHTGCFIGAGIRALKE